MGKLTKKEPDNHQNGSDSFMVRNPRPAKNKGVQEKHGISFEEAKEVFRDVTASFGGELISEQPDQFVTIGFSRAGTLITVVYEFRSDDDDEYIWLVTLWKTTKAEKRRFKI